MRKPENFGSVRELDPCLGIFLTKNGTHVERILEKKKKKKKKATHYIIAAHPRLP